MAELPEPLPVGPHVDLKTGNFTQAMRDWLETFATNQQSNNTQIGGVLSGYSQLQQQAASDRAAALARDNAERDSRISGDVSVAGGGTGDPSEGTANSTTYSGIVTSGASWITAATTTITPTGAGNYTFSILADSFVENGAGLSSGTAFNGNWRLVEEENGGGVPIVIDSGTFTVDVIPQEIYGGEGGEPFTVGPFTTATFNDLPAAPIASTYAVKTDLRFEWQRASGTNDVTAPGLSGSMGVSWA